MWMRFFDDLDLDVAFECFWTNVVFFWFASIMDPGESLGFFWYCMFVSKQKLFRLWSFQKIATNSTQKISKEKLGSGAKFFTLSPLRIVFPLPLHIFQFLLQYQLLRHSKRPYWQSVDVANAALRTGFFAGRSHANFRAMNCTSKQHHFGCQHMEVSTALGLWLHYITESFKFGCSKLNLKRIKLSFRDTCNNPTHFEFCRQLCSPLMPGAVAPAVRILMDSLHCLGGLWSCTGWAPGDATKTRLSMDCSKMQRHQYFTDFYWWKFRNIMRNPLQWIGIWLELADKKQRKSWIWMKLEQLSPSESPWPCTVIFHIPNSFFNRSLFCPNTWIKLQNGPRFSRCHSSTSYIFLPRKSCATTGSTVSVLEASWKLMAEPEPDELRIRKALEVLHHQGSVDAKKHAAHELQVVSFGSWQCRVARWKLKHLETQKLKYWAGGKHT